jgi:hypothetical protein
VQILFFLQLLLLAAEKAEQAVALELLVGLAAVGLKPAQVVLAILQPLLLKAVMAHLLPPVKVIMAVLEILMVAEAEVGPEQQEVAHLLMLVAMEPHPLFLDHPHLMLVAEAVLLVTLLPQAGLVAEELVQITI